MSLSVRESQRHVTRIENGLANDREPRRRQMIFCKRVRVRSDLRWAAACGGLATPVTAVRVLMPLMCRAGAMMLMNRARSRWTTRLSSGAETDAVDDQRQYRND